MTGLLLAALASANPLSGELMQIRWANDSSAVSIEMRHKLIDTRRDLGTVELAYTYDFESGRRATYALDIDVDAYAVEQVGGQLAADYASYVELPEIDAYERWSGSQIPNAGSGIIKPLCGYNSAEIRVTAGTGQWARGNYYLSILPPEPPPPPEPADPIAVPEAETVVQADAAPEPAPPLDPSLPPPEPPEPPPPPPDPEVVQLIKRGTLQWEHHRFTPEIQTGGSDPNGAIGLYFSPTCSRVVWVNGIGTAETVLRLMPAGPEIEITAPREIANRALPRVALALSKEGWAAGRRGIATEDRPQSIVYAGRGWSSAATEVARSVPGGATIQPMHFRSNADIVIAIGHSALE